uniref:Uncharacterized protein n=1 Tax=Anguilla anguilla TaxID=7936 RepID=A0A0E9WAU5_ANGAN
MFERGFSLNYHQRFTSSAPACCINVDHHVSHKHSNRSINTSSF